tara:strand:- start:191 stop:340 length:150 start_codon:yes stop_codon:yes gene_type:complete
MFKIVGGFSKQQFLKLFIEIAGTYSAAMIVMAVYLYLSNGFMNKIIYGK